MKKVLKEQNRKEENVNFLNFFKKFNELVFNL